MTDLTLNEKADIIAAVENHFITSSPEYLANFDLEVLEEVDQRLEEKDSTGTFLCEYLWVYLDHLDFSKLDLFEGKAYKNYYEKSIAICSSCISDKAFVTAALHLIFSYRHKVDEGFKRLEEN